MRQDLVTLFHITLVGRTTPAINYRPRHDDTPLDFAGTSLQPRAEGHANISGEKGYIPSDVVVMENVVRKGLWDDTNGRVEPLQAKYELLRRGAYLMNTDAALVRWPALEPGAPLDLAQARNAVEIARLARADGELRLAPSGRLPGQVSIVGLGRNRPRALAATPSRLSYGERGGRI